VAPDLAQEKLQRVRRRLQDLGRPWGSRGLTRRLLGGLDDLDRAFLELAVDELDVGRIDLEGVERLGQLSGVEEAGGLAALEQVLNFLVLEDARLVKPAASPRSNRC